MGMWRYGTESAVPGSGSPGPFSSDPGDTVGWLYEDPAELANGSIQIRAMLGCALTAEWAGATIYFSPNGASYRMAFQTNYRTPLGATINALAAGAADYQPAGTVDVDLSFSPGTLASTDLSGLLAGVNKCIIGDEICTFQSAVLIAANHYRLTGLLRGWYDTSRILHPPGERFALLSERQATIQLPEDWYGATEPWYWKAASVNIGGAEQSLADAHEQTLILTLRGLHIEFQKGRTKQFIAGETLTEGQHVYLNTADLRIYKAVSSSVRKLGLVQDPGTPVAAGGKVYVQMDGLMSCPAEATPVGTTWSWTPGALLYGSAVAGALSATDDNYAPVAVCLDNPYTILIFAPRPMPQDLTTDSTTVTFGVATLGNSGLHVLDTNASHDLIIAPGSDLTADRILTITTGDAARLLSLLADLYVEAESRVNQDLTTDSSPTLAGATFGSAGNITVLLTTPGWARVRFDSTNANAGARNWALTNQWTNYGTLDFVCGNAAGAAPSVVAAYFDNAYYLHVQKGLQLLTGAPFIGEYQTQSGAWAAPAGGVNGQIVTVYNSTAASSRIYVYTNGAWKQVAVA